MAFGKNAKTRNESTVHPEAAAPRQRVRTHWMRGVVMSLVVAGSNVIYFLWTGDSLPSPLYGTLTRHGNESNPGGGGYVDDRDAALCGILLLDASKASWERERKEILSKTLAPSAQPTAVSLRLTGHLMLRISA